MSTKLPKMKCLILKISLEFHEYSLNYGELTIKYPCSLIKVSFAYAIQTQSIEFISKLTFLDVVKCQAIVTGIDKGSRSSF